jgi:hypothetical protein
MEVAVEIKHARRLAAIVATLIVLAAPTPTLGAETVHMQALLNADGSGRLLVNNAPSPGGTWSWEACSPNLTACAPFGSGADIDTGAAAPETVFRVNGEGNTGLSPVWHGILSVTKAPSVAGAIRANELVKPIPATWSGGWDGDFDQTQLAACTTPDGHDCLSITDPQYVAGCKEGATVLDPALTGRYLRIADRRDGPGTIFTLIAVVSPYGQEIWASSGSVAVAMLGRIRPASGPRAAACGPPALTPEQLGGSRRVPFATARIQCANGCRAVQVTLECECNGHAVLSVKRGDLRVSMSHRLHRTAPRGSRQPIPFRLTHRMLRRLGPGRARVTVDIEGTRVAGRTILLR